MILRPSDYVVWTGDGDEVRLYDTMTGDFQTLNATAARIWQLIAQGRPVSAIVAELVTDFAADDAGEAQVIEGDIREFVAALHAARLVVLVAQDAESAVSDGEVVADASASA
ncbi:MAG: PqqD family protein [Streptosporangiaceae bacterium]|nr:PqqD family protein [Streptosporangiaceae bacterium]